jgi:hypothetical protein
LLSVFLRSRRLSSMRPCQELVNQPTAKLFVPKRLTSIPYQRTTDGDLDIAMRAARWRRSCAGPSSR